MLLLHFVLQLAETHSCEFFETSAKTGHNVEQVSVSCKCSVQEHSLVLFIIADLLYRFVLHIVSIFSVAS